jgi:hypothetical protein
VKYVRAPIAGLGGGITGYGINGIGGKILDDKKYDLDLEHKIQKSAYEEGLKRMGEEVAYDLARKKCDENGILEGEFNSESFIKTCGDFYKDVTK